MEGQLTPEQQQAVEKEQQDLIQATVNLKPSELVGILEDEFYATDGILEGFNIASHIGLGDAIVFSSVMRMRNALASTVAWLRHHHAEEMKPEDEHSEDDL